MISRPKSVLFVFTWFLLVLSMASAGYCQSAQRPEAAGQQGNVSMSPKTANPAIAGMMAKQYRLERIWAETVRKIDQEIQKCDNEISLAHIIIAKAQKTGKIEAETLARQNLGKATKLKQSRLEKKHLAEQQLHRAKEMGVVLSRYLLDESVPADVRGVASVSSGEASLLRANSAAKPLTNSNAGYLAPGDEIQSGSSSRVELQILGGRGAITMGENSRLRVEKDDGDAEVIRTLQGKFHFVVDKSEKFEASAEKDLAGLKDKLARISDNPEHTYETFVKGLKAWATKKFGAKTRVNVVVAVRGTEFVVSENQDGSSELVVIEGKVDATGPDGKKSVMVETGQTISFSTAGTLSGVRQVGGAAISRWWAIGDDRN